MYISFDNGERWQSFQLNLPATPVTDIKLTRKDLVLSTQGRSFWILDNLTPLHQLKDELASSQAILFAPREAVRTPPRGCRGLSGRSGVQYPLAGAAIDYYLASAPASEITLDVLDGSGNLVRRFSSGGSGGDDRNVDADAAPTDDEEGGFRVRSGPTRLDKSA